MTEAYSHIQCPGSLPEGRRQQRSNSVFSATVLPFFESLSCPASPSFLSSAAYLFYSLSLRYPLHKLSSRLRLRGIVPYYLCRHAYPVQEISGLLTETGYCDTQSIQYLLFYIADMQQFMFFALEDGCVEFIHKRIILRALDGADAVCTVQAFTPLLSVTV